jgi:hypothetical protein
MGEETGIRGRSGTGQNTGRNTHGDDTIWEITHNSGTGPDDDIGADAHQLDHGAANTNPGPGTYMKLTS